ncbi:hypothetical protein KUCAC02_033267 [Chaenocephalus aceratus]|nr:hypothetical protein KUCAC02_033463 [Chaenocephalus aceratus]KAI4792617.1 hypothetical protein KUCAC02_033267 [Chaenocephalus aceratus]
MRPSGVGPPWSLQSSADVAPSGIGSSSSGAWAAPCGQAMEEEEDPEQPGTRSSTTTLDEEPCANQYIVIKILTSRDRPCVFFDGGILSRASRDWSPA